jgi:hypothetical protein
LEPRKDEKKFIKVEARFAGARGGDLEADTS